jgi:hypothetical protein
MTTHTNTTHRPRSQRTQLDKMVEATTVYVTYEELLAATATGYAPSLRLDDCGAYVGAALESDGRKVFWR